MSNSMGFKQYGTVPLNRSERLSLWLALCSCSCCRHSLCQNLFASLPSPCLVPLLALTRARTNVYLLSIPFHCKSSLCLPFGDCKSLGSLLKAADGNTCDVGADAGWEGSYGGPGPVVSSVFTSGHMMTRMHIKVSRVCIGFYDVFMYVFVTVSGRLDYLEDKWECFLDRIKGLLRKNTYQISCNLVTCRKWSLQACRRTCLDGAWMMPYSFHGLGS